MGEIGIYSDIYIFNTASISSTIPKKSRDDYLFRTVLLYLLHHAKIYFGSSVVAAATIIGQAW